MKEINNSGSKLRANDQKSDGVLYKIIQLREEAKNLLDGILKKNPSLSNSIKLLIGFRNRITHDYENVTYSFIEDIVNYDLVELKKEIERIIK